MRLAALLLVLTACTKKPPEASAPEGDGVVSPTGTQVTHATATPAAAPEGTRGDRGPSEPAPPAPAGTDAIEGLLRARDAADLPDAEALRVNGAPESLRWLASHADTMIVRERALAGLVPFEDAESRALCADTFRSDGHAKLRAAAIRCLETTDLTADDTLRNELLAALRDGDPRVGLAAVSTLAGVAGARSGLEAALDDAGVPTPVKDAIRALD